MFILDYQIDLNDLEDNGVSNSDEEINRIYNPELNVNKLHRVKLRKEFIKSKYEVYQNNLPFTGKKWVYYINTNIIYNGDFEEGIWNGKGKLTLLDHSEYEGDFINGKRNGFGKYKSYNGCVYIGEWKDDMKHGKGKYYTKEGIIYNGNYENDLLILTNNKTKNDRY